MVSAEHIINKFQYFASKSLTKSKKNIIINKIFTLIYMEKTQMQTALRKLNIISLIFLTLLYYGCEENGGSSGPSNGGGDSESPTISILSPTTEISYLSFENSITLSGMASDNEEVASIQWSSDIGNSGTAFGTESWTASDIPLSNGATQITVSAYDNTGNSASEEIIIYYHYCPNF